MARIKAKQILEFQDLGTGTTGQYPTWDATAGKYVLQNQPIGTKGQDGDHWTSSPGSPSSGINVGDQHLDTSTGNVSQWIGAGGWIGTGNIRGPQGDKGAPGAKGEKGDKGQDGDHWTSASGSPTSNGITGINAGDQYLDTDDGKVYQWDGFAWISTGIIKGDKGEKGDTGQDGDHWTSGPGLPNPGINVGDHHLDTNDGTVYQWNGSLWIYSVNIEGPKGDKGDRGEKGDKGDTGAGFNTIATPGNNRILTSDGTSNGAVAEPLFLFDGPNQNFQTGDIQFAHWKLAEQIKWTSNTHSTSMYFDASGAVYSQANQAALIIEPSMMVSNNVMDQKGGAPMPMMWDSIYGGVGYQLSSKRFKENIVDLEFDQASLFNEVRGIKYTGLDSDIVQVGFIAEDVEKFDPALVIHDSEGKPFSLDYSRMVPVLFEVIRDLRSRIEKLEQK